MIYFASTRRALVCKKPSGDPVHELMSLRGKLPAS
uniref:Uncharacterized protein n=1 Tax=Myoviridae sp. ctRPH1 TaxID=2826650 RepID=A0A8S5MAA8_9CAUD|nr:MAG TPA: hypothetical protein [Myoviridae sp. ctRPH1]